jgi:predicted nucleic acid-binding protein
MMAVLDVSGAVEIILKRGKFYTFKNVLENADIVIAPDLFVSELTNTLWKYHKSKIFDENECIKYIEDGIDLADTFIETKYFWREAFTEGIRNNHSVYDMYYAVIARRNNGVLITNDDGLSKICEKLLIRYIY